MVTVNEVEKLLPPFRNEKKLVTYRQSTNDIIDEILVTHDRYCEDYDKIYYLFDQNDNYQTAKNIWEFLKYRLKYTIESDNEQTVKSPSAILHPGEKIDCKHYSLFTGGILDAINRNEADNIEWCYRFAGYGNTKHIQHVFVVIKDGNSEYWIDPVLNSFNEHKKPNYFIDREPMALYTVSGIGDTSKEVTVNKDAAEANFLILVNNNVYGLKTMMQENPDVLYGSVQSYFRANGFDFNHLLKFL